MGAVHTEALAARASSSLRGLAAPAKQPQANKGTAEQHSGGRLGNGGEGASRGSAAGYKRGRGVDR